MMMTTVVASALMSHFLFVRVGPMAEGGRTAEVFFSEQAEAGDPRYVAKIAGASLFVQSADQPGTFRALTVRPGTDRLRATVPPGGSIGVVGVCEYGVLARPNQTPFLLRYYPKAVAGRPDELNGLKSAGGGAAAPGSKPIRLEIVPKFQADRIELTALREGKPMPGVLFTAVDSDLAESKTTAGPDGVATWTPPKPGRYSVYMRDTVTTEGEAGGASYKEIREFATLAFTWPLDRRDADTEAVALFEKAVATRAVWHDFAGFRADVAGTVDGRGFEGNVVVAADGSVKVDVEDEAASKWVDDQLRSIVMHRLPESGRDSSKPEGEASRPVLRFADGDTAHPLGRLLAFQGGRFASSYRVKDGQITVVNRHIGPQTMSITVLDNTPAADGTFLPHSYLVHYWDAATGALRRVETFQQRWSKVNGVDLPASQVVSTSSDAGLSVRSLTLSNHKVGGGK